MPKDYGDLVSEDGDDLAPDADIDPIPATEQVNGAGSDRSTSEGPAQQDEHEHEEEHDDEHEDAGSDNGDGEQGADEYVVEKIVGHKTTKGKIKYEVKWLGYPKDQNTWEPIANLLPDAREALTAYHNKIGVVPEHAKSQKKQKSTTSLWESTDYPPAKRRRTDDIDDGTYLPKKTNWESEVEKVDTIERDAEGQLHVFLRFTNGKKTRVSMPLVKKHCPVPMLEFYEKNLKFKLATD